MVKIFGIILLFISMCSIAVAQDKQFITIAEARVQYDEFEKRFDLSRSLKSKAVINYRKLIRLKRSGDRGKILAAITELSQSLAESSEVSFLGYNLAFNLKKIIRNQKESGWTFEQITLGLQWCNRLEKHLKILENRASRKPSESVMEKFAQSSLKKVQ